VDVLERSNERNNVRFGPTGYYDLLVLGRRVVRIVIELLEISSSNHDALAYISVNKLVTRKRRKDRKITNSPVNIISKGDLGVTNLCRFVENSPYRFAGCAVNFYIKIK
jgi:hypothetical protein